MTDEIDKSNERELAFDKAMIELVRKQAREFDPGEPGECELCGEDMPRLVQGVCCPCRDKRGLE